MRFHHFAAALLVGGSAALAGAPSYQPVGAAIADSAARVYANMANRDLGNPDLDLAADPDGLDTSAAYAAYEADAGATGMGGPYEPVVAALDTSVRPATQNYPACDPGPGDDSCIQLYEPGVQVALASWTQPTGGLLDHAAAEAQTAMGGPYEPVETAGDGTVEAIAPKAVAEEIAHYMTSASQAEFTGTGGPTSETGYPACSATVTDRCIQLYERGVTGEGN